MFGINKKVLVDNLVAFLPYRKGNFVEGHTRTYLGMGFWSESTHPTQGIVTGFELEEGMLVCNVTTRGGYRVTMLATEAKRISELVDYTAKLKEQSAKKSKR